jgi:hypothetical protein
MPLVLTNSSYSRNESFHVPSSAFHLKFTESNLSIRLWFISPFFFNCRCSLIHRPNCWLEMSSFAYNKNQCTSLVYFISSLNLSFPASSNNIAETDYNRSAREDFTIFSRQSINVQFWYGSTGQGTDGDEFQPSRAPLVQLVKDETEKVDATRVVCDVVCVVICDVVYGLLSCHVVGVLLLFVCAVVQLCCHSFVPSLLCVRNQRCTRIRCTSYPAVREPRCMRYRCTSNRAVRVTLLYKEPRCTITCDV